MIYTVDDLQRFAKKISDLLDTRPSKEMQEDALIAVIFSRFIKSSDPESFENFIDRLYNVRAMNSRKQAERKSLHVVN